MYYVCIKKREDKVTSQKNKEEADLKVILFFDLPFRVVGAEGVEPPTLCL